MNHLAIAEILIILRSKIYDSPSSLLFRIPEDAGAAAEADVEELAEHEVKQTNDEKRLKN